MIELYLDEKTREALLNYDIVNTEHDYDRDMYYITNSESQIIYDIIYVNGEELLKEVGFSVDEIEDIMEDDLNVKFTDKSEHYIKKVD